MGQTLFVCVYHRIDLGATLDCKEEEPCAERRELVGLVGGVGGEAVEDERSVSEFAPDGERRPGSVDELGTAALLFAFLTADQLSDEVYLHPQIL